MKTTNEIHGCEGGHAVIWCDRGRCLRERESEADDQLCYKRPGLTQPKKIGI